MATSASEKNSSNSFAPTPTFIFPVCKISKWPHGSLILPHQQTGFMPEGETIKSNSYIYNLKLCPLAPYNFFHQILAKNDYIAYEAHQVNLGLLPKL
jgi:hypothetical protein